ncbi:type II toxin-antitoxin system ParD family antitoxin [Patescibacteria group bacterium]
MTTINISLPIKLKTQAEALVKGGYYASFSDLVRDSLRRLVEKSKYDLWLDEAKEDLRKGEAVVLKSDKEIDNYLKGT